MIAVLCPKCGANSGFQILGNIFFHLGSVKKNVLKQFINSGKHEPICLWCGYLFKRIEEVLDKNPKVKRL